MLMLPDWLPLDAWTSFLEMRSKHKWVLTERAERQLINRLAAYREQGYDIEAMLDEASERNWRSVWPTDRTPRFYEPRPTVLEPLSPKLQAVRDRIDARQSQKKQVH